MAARSTFVILAATALAALTAVETTSAQSLFTRDRNESVLQRERAEYYPLGIRAGTFIFKPKVDLTVGYTDNVFAVSEEVSPTFADQEDVFGVLRPSFVADSDWNRHSLSFGGYAEAYQHADFDSENVENYGVNADGRIDVFRNAFILLGGRYDLLNETRRANNAVFVPIEPVEYDRANVYAGWQHEFGRIRYRGRLDYTTFDYDDVETFDPTDPATPPVFLTSDQDFRDRADTSVLLQAGYAVTRDASIFLRGTWKQRDFDNLSPTAIAGTFLDRNSEGYTLAAGVDFDITSLIRGNVAVGYLEEEFDDPSLSTLDGTFVDAGIEWFPTDLTTLGLSASREAKPSNLFSVDDNGTPDDFTDDRLFVADGGFLSTEIVLRADHELRRNIILSGSVGYGLDEYEDIDREDERIGASLGGTWLINRNFAARLQYNYLDQDTEASGPNTGLIKDFQENEIMLTLTAQR